MQAVSERYLLEQSEHCNILHLISADGLNRLTRERVLELIEVVGELRQDAARLDSTAKNAPKPLVITGNQHYFSAGADLKEIASLKAVEAFEFSNMGQKLMSLIDDFPTPVYAAISGYCMGGGLDLALACDFRICAPNAIFGHRGAALGLVTGWGGTQGLPRIVGRACAMQLFAAAEKLHASEALDIGLVSEISPGPIARCTAIAEKPAKQYLHEG